jgi:serine-type D-Ala-D-Ala carboxypeptidase/endopeptidase (penicillin-binding protein 4)
MDYNPALAVFLARRGSLTDTLDRNGGRSLAFLLGLLLSPAILSLGQAKPSPTAPAAPVSSERAPNKAEAAQARTRADLERFRARVEATLARPGADKGYWGVLVMDARTGEVLYALNAQRYFTPASNTKLFSTALAMAALGPDYRFRTAIETHGTLDRSGRLRGDLVLAGRGDPNLSNRKLPMGKEVERDGPPEKVLAEFADRVAARSVKQIEGDVVADDSYFAYERFPSGWDIDDMLWGYGAAISAVAVNDNTIAIELRSGEREGARASFHVEPRNDFYKIRNEVTTGPRGSEQKLEVSREPGSRLIRVGGTMPLNAEPHTLTLAVEEPAEYAAQLLKRLLEARGVRVSGEARARHSSYMGSRKTPGATVDPPVVLAEHTAVPLIEAVRVVNKTSQNLGAELLLRVAALEKAGASDGEAVLKFAQQFFKGIGIDEGEVVLFDGSGLSRRNLVTPQAVVQLLTYIAQQPWAEAFRSTLPVAGEDGTLSDRMKDTPAAGRLWAKTGSLGHVNSLSGYATTLGGARLIFSMFGNNHILRGKEATGVLDAISTAMIEEIGAWPEEKNKE